MPTFDITLDYKTDVSPEQDPDSDSPQLKADHELLWTKELSSGVLFEPKEPSDAKTRRTNYLLFEDIAGGRFTYGSDAITNSYTRWSRSKSRSLADAKALLTEDQRSRFLDTPYTAGSAMIWPVRTTDQPTMNTARGFGPEGALIGDRRT